MQIDQDLLSPLAPTEEELIQYLRRCLDGVSWEVFQQREDGVCQINGYLFFMRVGIIMKKPTQAIMAAGLFVRTRPLPENYTWFGRNPKLLDPSDRGCCLYRHGEERKPSWNPIPPDARERPRDTTILDAAGIKLGPPWTW